MNKKTNEIREELSIYRKTFAVIYILIGALAGGFIGFISALLLK